MCVRGGSEDDLTGQAFHLFDCFPELSLIAHGPPHGRKLVLAEGYGNGFLSDFSGPLVSAAARSGDGALEN